MHERIFRNRLTGFPASPSLRERYGTAQPQPCWRAEPLAAWWPRAAIARSGPMPSHWLA